jgi:hypothetical protein
MGRKKNPGVYGKREKSKMGVREDYSIKILVLRIKTF